MVGRRLLDQAMGLPHRQVVQRAAHGSVRQSFLHLDVNVPGARAARAAVQRQRRPREAIRRVDLVRPLAHEPLHRVGVAVPLGPQRGGRGESRRALAAEEPQRIPAVPLLVPPAQRPRPPARRRRLRRGRLAGRPRLGRDGRRPGARPFDRGIRPMACPSRSERPRAVPERSLKRLIPRRPMQRLHRVPIEGSPCPERAWPGDRAMNSAPAGLCVACVGLTHGWGSLASRSRVVTSRRPGSALVSESSTSTRVTSARSCASPGPSVRAARAPGRRGASAGPAPGPGAS